MNPKRIKQSKNESGFTLVEVLASLVIISIIFIGAFNLIISTNEVAVSNNNRLVAINLGKATIERIKVDPFSYFSKPSEENDYIVNAGEEGILYDVNHCGENENCKKLYKIKINDKNYLITVKISQDEDEKRMKLIDVLVTVNLSGENVTHQIEGYINYANK